MEQTADLLLRILPTLWLGMALAISFLETPLKFRAPGITLELGLGIGRVVFHALNRVELAFATLLVLAVATNLSDPATSVVAALAVAILALLAQVFALRPTLDSRLDRRVAGEDVPRSHHHVLYIGLEATKVVALAVAAVTVAWNA